MSRSTTLAASLVQQHQLVAGAFRATEKQVVQLLRHILGDLTPGADCTQVHLGVGTSRALAALHLDLQAIPYALTLYTVAERVLPVATHTVQFVPLLPASRLLNEWFMLVRDGDWRCAFTAVWSDDQQVAQCALTTDAVTYDALAAQLGETPAPIAGCADAPGKQRTARLLWHLAAIMEDVRSVVQAVGDLGLPLGVAWALHTQANRWQLVLQTLQRLAQAEHVSLYRALPQSSQLYPALSTAQALADLPPLALAAYHAAQPAPQVHLQQADAAYISDLALSSTPQPPAIIRLQHARALAPHQAQRLGLIAYLLLWSASAYGLPDLPESSLGPLPAADHQSPEPDQPAAHTPADTTPEQLNTLMQQAQRWLDAADVDDGSPTTGPTPADGAAYAQTLALPDDLLDVLEALPDDGSVTIALDALRNPIALQQNDDTLELAVSPQVIWPANNDLVAVLADLFKHNLRDFEARLNRLEALAEQFKAPNAPGSSQADTDVALTQQATPDQDFSDQDFPDQDFPDQEQPPAPVLHVPVSTRTPRQPTAHAEAPTASDVAEAAPAPPAAASAHAGADDSLALMQHLLGTLHQYLYRMAERVKRVLRYLPSYTAHGQQLMRQILEEIDVALAIFGQLLVQTERQQIRSVNLSKLLTDMLQAIEQGQLQAPLQLQLAPDVRVQLDATGLLRHLKHLLRFAVSIPAATLQVQLGQNTQATQLTLIAQGARYDQAELHKQLQLFAGGVPQSHALALARYGLLLLGATLAVTLADETLTLTVSIAHTGD